MAKHYANPAFGKHMGDDVNDEDDDDLARPEGAGQDEETNVTDTKPDIHITSHSGGHTVHVLPKDGSPATTEEHDDHESAGEAVKGHLSGMGQRDDAGGAELSPTTKKLNVHRPA